MKKSYVLIAVLTLIMFKGFAQPSTPAPTPPARNSSNVISVLGNTYSSLTGTDFDPNWGQTGFATANTTLTIGGVPTLNYPNFNYQGNQFASAINASSMTSVHIDVWSADCTKLDFYLIDAPTDHESHYTIDLAPSTWNSVDIPLTAFTTATLNDIIQFKLVSNTPTTSNIYVENMYFWKSSNVPTITGFTVPAKMVGDAPFTLTDPTSNSTGAFTYTSSDNTVATISGNVVTIVGGGTTIITATQAAAGSYVAGTTSATLVVNFASPTTAAPVPTQSAVNVISLWGNTYTNVTGINWHPDWGQATSFTGLNIGGDTTIEYASLNYEGVQTTTALDVSQSNYFHLDLWTPNTTKLVLKLINSAAVTGSAPLEVADTLTPTLSGWNSFDIPMSVFNTLDLTKVDQMSFTGINPATGGVIYLQNIYFYKTSTSNAPTLTGFTVPAKVVGDAPFTLTAPTSNSSGTFTYTSSDLTVATISGSTVTIVGAGTTTITATQAASGNFSSGSITANLVVTAKGNAPTTSAPAPTADAANVLSLLGSHYTQNPAAAGTGTWLQGWGQKAQASYLNINGDTTIKYSPLDYAGVQFSSAINVSTYDTLHLDIWTPDLTGIFLDLIATNENSDTINLVPGQWNSISIPLSVYTANSHKLGAPNAPCDLSQLLQFNFIGNNPGVTPQGTTGTIYLENVYFVQKAGKPTLGAFTVPAQLIGAAPFTLTPPTSTSPGAFTYTSSNTSVATINGNTVTIVGTGSTLITATQAAAGGYSSASTSTTFVVSYPAPSTAAPIPTTPWANVISLFSDSYSNVAGTNFDTRWGGKNVVSYDSIQGNNTMVYNNFDFEGIQLTGSLDVSKASYIHVDIYTPDCSSLRLNLINTTSPPVQVGDTLVPTLNQWTSFDIPLSKFSPVALNSINQLMFDLGNGGNTVYIDNLYFWDPNNVLPVKLVDFSAVANGNNAFITWKSSVETNLKGFYVQKSTNGNTWSNVTYVAGQGSNTNYSAVDNATSTGLNYYRLAETDLTGRITYSNVVTVNFSKVGVGFSFYPNPVKDRLTVSLQTIQSQSATLRLVSLEGKIIKTVQLGSGNSNSSVSVDAAGLAKGIYLLTLKDGDIVKTSKVLVN